MQPYSRKYWCTRCLGIVVYRPVVLGRLQQHNTSYYIDGETTPSVQGSIDLLTGNAPSPKSQRKTIPWGNEALGRLGIGGGAYTTTKIPFTRSILVTAYMSDSNTAQTIRDMNNGVKYSESEGGRVEDAL